MSENNRSAVGVVLAIGLLGVVVCGAFGFEYLRRQPSSEGTVASPPDPVAKEMVTVTALVGGEKMGFVKNPRVVEILKDRYGLTLDASKSGSMEMVQSSAPGKDVLWPSTQTAAELYQANGGQAAAKENIFASPVVFYAWDTVSAALVTHGIASEVADVRYVDVAKLTDAIIAEKTWKDLGLPTLFGKVKVYSTDPNRSSSGSMFVGLLASTLNNGEVPDETTSAAVLPKLQAYFARMGAMEASSSDLFANFLNQGVGARPMIVGYENQLVEFGIEHAEFRDVLTTRIHMLYPQPTTWSEHPVIAVTPNGKRLIEALKDPEVQKIAWEQHGFRSGLMGVQNDPKLLGVAGIAPQVDSVTPMPGARVMQQLLAGIAR